MKDKCAVLKDKCAVTDVNIGARPKNEIHPNDWEFVYYSPVTGWWTPNINYDQFGDGLLEWWNFATPSVRIKTAKIRPGMRADGAYVTKLVRIIKKYKWMFVDPYSRKEADDEDGCVVSTPVK